MGRYGLFAMAGLDDFLEEWNSPSPYVKAHTSGSTGKPKDILLLKSDMRQSALATNAFFGINEHSVLAVPLSMEYIAGKMMAVRALEAGARLIEIPPAKEFRLPDNTGCISLLPVVPLHIDCLLGQPDMASRIKNLLIGGGAPDFAQCKALASAGYRAYISYGMTETCSHVALARADDELRRYHAMPGISFDVDSRGCLIVEAPHFSFKRLVTNDVVDLLSNTSFCWRGRIDGVINSGGIKMLPEELENLYAPFLGSTPFYVTKEPHPVWGEAVVLVYEGSMDMAGDIQTFMRQGISDSRRLPKRYIAVNMLPRTYNGKIQRIIPREPQDGR